MNYTPKTTCRCCLGTKLYEFLDLGSQPLANEYLNCPSDIGMSASVALYPLSINFCPQCFHSQLSVVVDPKILFKYYNYVSGTSETGKKYFQKFAKDYTDRLQLRDERMPRVLDISCNDGSQLDAFKELGWDTYGVDPAENIVSIAREKGHTVICDFWGKEAAEILSSGQFDLIVAQNVFAHVDDVDSFLEHCKRVLHANGLLVIQTSQANMIINGEYDTIYHEHLSFFNTRSMNALVNRNYMDLESVRIESIHGGSYVFEICHEGIDKLAFKTPSTEYRGKYGEIYLQMEREEYDGLYDPETYYQFGVRAHAHASMFRNQLVRESRETPFVIGYGAAAKGMTVLNFAGITVNELCAIVDDSPLKQGKWTPGSNIRIMSLEALKTALSGYKHRIVIVVLAWNFFDEIVSKIKAQLDPSLDITFIKPFTN